MAFHIGGLAMALFFGAVVVAGGSPITPEIYGAWVYKFPALLWVAVQVAITGAGAISAALKWKRTCGVISFLLGVYLAFFAALAMGAGAAGTILMTGAGFWLAPLAFMAALLCWGVIDE